MIALTAAEESRFRRAAGAERCPVRVVGGDAAPKRCGERAFTTFRGSNSVVKFPGAARRAGYKLDYHASTYRVEVGEAYVRRERAAKIESGGAYKKAMRRLLKVFAPDAPRSVMADWLDDQGDAAGASLLREIQHLTE